MFLAQEEAKRYFEALRLTTGLSYSEIADKLGVSPRTLRDWRCGVYSFPLLIAEQIEETYQIELPDGDFIKAESEIKSRTGRLGAIERYKRYGNPGTLEGRVKGGRNSILTHNRRKTGFRLRKRFPTLRESVKLAEFIGIMLGDGGMTEGQVRITLSSRDDRTYTEYVQKLMYELYSEPASITERRGNIIELVISGKNLVRDLRKKGLVIGNKIKQGACIPNWILKKESWRRAVLKGLFDTDGSVYLDRHRRNGVNYQSICIAYTTYSRQLFKGIFHSLVFLGFSPTKSSKNRVMLRKRKEVEEFFKHIDPENAKHQLRYKKYLEE